MAGVPVVSKHKGVPGRIVGINETGKNRSQFIFQGTTTLLRGVWLQVTFLKITTSRIWVVPDNNGVCKQWLCESVKHHLYPHTTTAEHRVGGYPNSGCYARNLGWANSTQYILFFDLSHLNEY